MKTYRRLVPIALVALMAASWYTLISDRNEVAAAYDDYLAQARKYAESGSTKYAIENYTKALAVNDDPDVYVEVANYYKNHSTASTYESWCEDFFESYPTEPKAFDCLLDAYLIQEDYESCYDILNTAAKRNVSTDFIRETSEDIKYVYRLDYNTYENVGIYSNNFCAVQKDGLWGFVDRYGEKRISSKYTQVGAYTKTNFVSVVNSSGEAYFIDKEGSKVLASTENYASFGLLSGEMVAAQKADGRYTYLDSELQPMLGDYDYASTMNGGIAAVKMGEQWQLIDSSGNIIGGTSYLDIKLDEKQIAYRNGRAFVSTTAGEYVMIDENGTKIGNLTFEDAKVFAGEAPTAVKMAGKWCFIDAEGKLVSDQKYDDARSYANGLAAVCIDGKWGFIDESGSIAIEPQFFNAKDFNEKGSCFVKTGDKWQLLKLYRLNRES